MRAAGIGEGDGPALGVAVAPGWVPAVAAGSPWSISRSAARSSSVITVKSRSTASTPSRAVTASVTRLVISLRSGQPAMVRATWTSTRAAVDGDAPDHAEVDDAAVQLGVLDGAQGLDDVGFGDGHAVAPDGRSAMAGGGRRGGSGGPRRRPSADFSYGGR